MALTEFAVVHKARKFVIDVNPTAIPVSVEDYARSVGAVIRPQTDLGPDEPGMSFAHDGKRYICVNAGDRPERQRFTVCHEVAHIVLGLQSDHSEPQWSYAKRPLAEIFCDVFAAELLLPYKSFQPAAVESSTGLAAVDALADRFLASTTATGSRFASVVTTPCAFVLSEHGKIRYASRSKSLIDASAWIPPRTDLPRGTLSHRAHAGGPMDREEVDAAVWFSNWERGGKLLEEARYLDQWDQTLTLLWFDDDEVPPLKRRARDDDDAVGLREDEEELGLQELDGHLPWPGKKRRR
ncbi:MAG TPA: ImmA/IrrE family metallo-endopeptidase [Candidatus Polarisedimenticolaceae bacterium]|nr:ImmA/IrrE family metallo-endopeptidase [Candidatus Polarisedimenticolaceae bacterium]